ncbi:hypothetical protein M7I_2700 [Glarea lozoyensis 74030]|uniref:Amine oxidase domain-containing protein n=1 Tax=Glarea lozoyensis (strain ATCC 74030 / MF5533) TaxID=1104152 RepID=H0EJH4_GLAL7|nr:hypothetical protein M7I_2700 [Glarea lozoyensis 74030]
MSVNRVLCLGGILAGWVTLGTCGVAPPTYDGTYAAVRLREDFKKSVLVVEKSTVLGGHVDTYNTRYIDLRTGKPSAFVPQDPTAALGAFAAQAYQYPYLVDGYSLPDPVPADLLLPFGDFVKKYNLAAAIPTFLRFGSNLGNMNTATTLYVLMNFGIPQLANDYLITSRHDNSELYRAAAKLLGKDVLYSSTVKDAECTARGTHVLKIKTKDGTQTVYAKKLLITIPPTKDNMNPFNPTDAEAKLYEKFKYGTYWTGLVRGGIPDGISVQNSANGSPYYLPGSPYVENFDFTGVPGLHSFHAVSTDGFPLNTEVGATVFTTAQLVSMTLAKTFNVQGVPKVESDF